MNGSIGEENEVSRKCSLLVGPSGQPRELTMVVAFNGDDLRRVLSKDLALYDRVIHATLDASTDFRLLDSGCACGPVGDPVSAIDAIYKAYGVKADAAPDVGAVYSHRLQQLIDADRESTPEEEVGKIDWKVSWTARTGKSAS